MPLSPRERFQMVRRMTVEIDDDQAWPVAHLDILLRQYGLESIDLEDRWSSKTGELGRIVGGAADEVLLQLYATVLDIDESEARLAAGGAVDHELWQEGQVRLFISHSAHHKRFVGEIASELSIVGVHGFVAHDSMEIERPWQAQIETALRTAEAFLAVVHEPFNHSAWCQQEVGWAKGRGLPEFYLRMDANPQAFAGSTQWPSGHGRSPQSIAQDVLAWLQRSTDLADRVVSGLIFALHKAGDYYSAEAAAKRIAALGRLSDADWLHLDEAFWSNDQVHHGILPRRVLDPFYRAAGRAFPPDRPDRPGGAAG